MCYVEDIYHSQCGHWGQTARTYHRCASAGSEQVCSYNKKCGSAQEDSLCKICCLDPTRGLKMDSGKRISHLLVTPEASRGVGSQDCLKWSSVFIRNISLNVYADFHSQA